MSTLLIVAGMLAFNLILTVLFVWLGAKLVKAPRRTMLRAVTVTIAMVAVNLLIGMCVSWLRSLDSRPAESATFQQLSGAFAGLLAMLLLDGLVIKAITQANYSRALLVWLIAQVPSLIGVAAVLLVIQPFILTGYIATNNSMSPTVAGWHTVDVCPHCGQQLFVSDFQPGSDEARYARITNPDDRRGICSNCFKSSNPKALTETIEVPDRFACNKLMTPRRWDIMTFRYPEDPNVKYVKRLVGLPGEEVFVDEGSVWINGEKLTPPEPISKLRYVSGDELHLGSPFGSRAKPCKLQANEYFVLGDFSQSSSDSRYWGPVPGDHIEGVVTVRYWPPDRFHIWR